MKLSRRALFARLLGALAAVPLVGKAAAKRTVTVAADPTQGTLKTQWLWPEAQRTRGELEAIYPRVGGCAGGPEALQRWLDYKFHYPEHVAAHDAELRRLFPILYEDD